MTHTAKDHLEHAEHAKRATHTEFDKTVTMTIAIVAAVMAGVTMLGHRAHNETLRLQGAALQAQTEGGIQHSQAGTKWALAANKWALYQAQRALRDLAKRENISLRLFHGRGGAIGRGGGPANQAILSQPPGSIGNQIKISEAADRVRILRRQIDFFNRGLLSFGDGPGGNFRFNYLHDGGSGRSAKLRFELNAVPVPRVVTGGDHYSTRAALGFQSTRPSRWRTRRRAAVRSLSGT